MKQEAYTMSLLLDYYGSLLTEKQKTYFDLYYNQDLSLSEIAEQESISRQGVHDLVRRCNHILQEYEDKLHLVERFMKIRSRVEQLKQLTNDSEITKDKLIEEIESYRGDILQVRLLT